MTARRHLLISAAVLASLTACGGGGADSSARQEGAASAPSAAATADSSADEAGGSMEQGRSLAAIDYAFPPDDPYSYSGVREYVEALKKLAVPQYQALDATFMAATGISTCSAIDKSSADTVLQNLTTGDEPLPEDTARAQIDLALNHICPELRG